MAALDELCGLPPAARRYFREYRHWMLALDNKDADNSQVLAVTKRQETAGAIAATLLTAVFPRQPKTCANVWLDDVESVEADPEALRVTSEVPVRVAVSVVDLTAGLTIGSVEAFCSDILVAHAAGGAVAEA